LSCTTTVLIVGAAGQLGGALRDVISTSTDWQIHGCDHDTVDVTDAGALTDFVTSHQPRFVINCAALTNVDRCETDDATERVNTDSVATLAKACDAVQAKLVQMSSDFIFNGQHSTPYQEDDPPAPLNRYARSKVQAETHARLAKQHLIVRTAWLFGEHGANFVQTMLKYAAAGKPLRVVDDQTGSPSYAPDVAEGILHLLQSEISGCCHVVNTGQATWYELARTAITQAKLPLDIEPIATHEYPSPAQRPAYSVLGTQRYLALIGRQLRPWEQGLADYVRNVLPNITGGQ
jgi:dTDP-4-dehydrorhamnose reductase